jgi:hypothetical protein
LAEVSLSWHRDDHYKGWQVRTITNNQPFSSVALQSLKDLGRVTYRRFLELFRHMVGLLGRVISPSQGLYLHRTTQHRKTRTNIHALSGIRAHDPSNQPTKTRASDRTATVTGNQPLVGNIYTIGVSSVHSSFGILFNSRAERREFNLFNSIVERVR